MFFVYRFRQKIIRFFEYLTLMATIFFPQVANSVELNTVNFFVNSTFDLSLNGLRGNLNLEHQNVGISNLGKYFSSYDMAESSLTAKSNQSMLFRTMKSQDMFRLNMRFNEALSTAGLGFNSAKRQGNSLKQEYMIRSLVTSVNPPFLWGTLLQEKNVKINPFVTPFKLPPIAKQPKQLHLPAPESLGMMFFGILAMLAWSRRKRTQRNIIRYTQST